MKSVPSLNLNILYAELIRHGAGLPLIGTQPPCEVKVSDILYIEG